MGLFKKVKKAAKKTAKRVSKIVKQAPPVKQVKTISKQLRGKAGKLRPTDVIGLTTIRTKKPKVTISNVRRMPRKTIKKRLSPLRRPRRKIGK